MLKKPWRLFSFFALVIIAFIYYKTTYNKIVFKKITLDESNEIDTIERFHNDSLLLVDIIKNGALGHFAMRLGYIKHFGNESAVYQSNIKDWKFGGEVIRKLKKSIIDSLLMSFHSFDECPNRIAINPD